MERSYEDVASAFLEAGMEVALLTTQGYDPDGLLPAYERIWEIRVKRPGRYSFGWWWQSWKHSTSFRSWGPDAILSVSSAGGAIALRPSVRKISVAQCHGTALAEVRSSLASPRPKELAKLPLNILRIVREVVMYRCFNHVIAIGPAVHTQLMGPPLSLSPEKTQIINNGVEEAVWKFDANAREHVRRSLGIAPNAHVGVFAGRLHVQKGVDLAIKALSLLPPESDAHLVICGDGPERQELEGETKKMGLANRVHFLGKLKQQQVASALSAADIFVFPTRRYEGLPLNVLEAMASGLPVLTVAAANVPPALTANAEITACNARDLAQSWTRMKPNSDRSSRLTVEFTTRGSLKSYVDLILAQTNGDSR